MKRYFWCFPGLGKSSLQLPDLSVVDADCEQFKFRNVEPGELHGSPDGKSYERDEGYPQNYLNYIQSVESDVVLLNCHIDILAELDQEEVLLVYPDMLLIPEYLQRYKTRGDHPSFVAYMAAEAEGMIQYIERSGFDRFRVDKPGVYLRHLFERNDFKMKVMNRAELTQHIQRAMDLNVIGTELHVENPSKLVCDVKFAQEDQPHRIKNAAVWADAVLDGKYELDIDQLLNACMRREGELKREREKLISHFERAINLNVLDTSAYNNTIICDISFAEDGTFSSDAHDAYDLAEAVINGKYDVDIDNLLDVCKQRELQLEEMALADRRGGLSREELADKIMQGIVNGALGIRYSQIAPYSHGYEVTFGGIGPVGSTHDFKNRWECYCDLFDVPGKIVEMVENDRQSGRVFGSDTRPLRIGEMLQAIEDMESEQISFFVPEKDAGLERRGRYTGHVASVMDVHAGKALDGIVQHHFHGDYSSMTPVKQNNLVETLVFMKGFCLDCLDGLDIGPQGRQNVVDYLKKHGTDISTPEKLKAWIRLNPEKCGLEENRRTSLDAQIAKSAAKVSERDPGVRDMDKER